MREIEQHRLRRFRNDSSRAQVGLDFIQNGGRFETGSDRGMVDVTDKRFAELTARVARNDKQISLIKMRYPDLAET
jgi:hypothetical protein